jgi:hypothetical protein
MLNVPVLVVDQVWLAESASGTVIVSLPVALEAMPAEVAIVSVELPPRVKLVAPVKLSALTVQAVFTKGVFCVGVPENVIVAALGFEGAELQFAFVAQDEFVPAPTHVCASDSLGARANPSRTGRTEQRAK